MSGGFVHDAAAPDGRARGLLLVVLLACSCDAESPPAGSDPGARTTAGTSHAPGAGPGHGAGRPIGTPPQGGMGGPGWGAGGFGRSGFGAPHAGTPGGSGGFGGFGASGTFGVTVPNNPWIPPAPASPSSAPATALQPLQVVLGAGMPSPSELHAVVRSPTADTMVLAGAVDSRTAFLALVGATNVAGPNNWTASLKASAAGGACDVSAPFVEIAGLRLDGSGGVWVSGRYCGMLSFGQGRHSEPSQGIDGFVVQYDPHGSPLWDHRLGGSGVDWITPPLSRSATGAFGLQVMLANGSSLQAHTFGPDGRPHPPQPLAGLLGCSGRVTQLDAAMSDLGQRLALTGACDGQPVVVSLARDALGSSQCQVPDCWRESLGPARPGDHFTTARDVIVMHTGELVVGGQYDWETVSASGVTIDRSRGAFVEFFSKVGNRVWGRRYPGDVVVSDLSWGPRNEIVLGGWFRGVLDLTQGDFPRASTGARDGFVALLDPWNSDPTSTDPLRVAWVLAGSGNAWDLRCGSTGQALIVSGLFDTRLELGAKSLVSHAKDLFLARLAPPP
ncbi:MAG: hypothetical protein MJD61_10785 [Proteobacteria bacterium]|nr:hypothetical protein [Pseudomonadota bacterium]